MAAEEDVVARTCAGGSMKYTRVEEQSSVEDCYDSANCNNKSEKSPDAVSVPPAGGFKEGNGLKSPSRAVAFSPREIKENNGIAVSTAAEVAAKRIDRHRRRWQATVKALRNCLSKLSPAAPLKKLRDCYVKSVGNLAYRVSASGACVGTYGTGHCAIDNLPAGWRAGSNRYKIRDSEADGYSSASFRQSMKETAISQSSRNIGSKRQISPDSVSSISCRGSSVRVYASSNMQPMPIYTIQET